MFLRYCNSPKQYWYYLCDVACLNAFLCAAGYTGGAHVTVSPDDVQNGISVTLTCGVLDIPAAGDRWEWFLNDLSMNQPQQTFAISSFDFSAHGGDYKCSFFNSTTSVTEFSPPVPVCRNGKSVEKFRGKSYFVKTTTTWIFFATYLTMLVCGHSRNYRSTNSTVLSPAVPPFCSSKQKSLHGQSRMRYSIVST